MTDEVLKLVRDLREMDQLIYQMGQATDAHTLRMLLQRALAITNERIRRESDRIADLLIPEIKKVYIEDSSCTTKPPLAAPLKALPSRNS